MTAAKQAEQNAQKRIKSGKPGAYVNMPDYCKSTNKQNILGREVKP